VHGATHFAGSDVIHIPVGQLEAAAVVVDGVYLAVLDGLCRRERQVVSLE